MEGRPSDVVGEIVGDIVGENVGSCVGSCVGSLVGSCVGSRVLPCVCLSSIMMVETKRESRVGSM